MGYMRHHAILVTSGIERHIRRAFERAEMTFPLGSVLGPVESSINNYWTFVVTPDGSKEGWSESETGDEARDAFIAWLRSEAYEDGSSPFSWAEVQYGDDDDENIVTRHDADATHSKT